MTRHVVARVDELPEGSRKIVTVGGREIGVFNVDGAYYAIRNRCPHQGGPLCLGQQLGRVSSSTPGEYEFEPGGLILRCPWHQWEFDLRTGQSWFDPAKVRVRAYDARVESGATLLADRADVAAPAPQPGLEPGPYVAEVYAVAVEHDYVVVELDNGRAGREEAA